MDYLDKHYNIWAVDFDLTLIDKEGKPMSESVKKVNELYENPSNFIVIHTARSYSMFHEIRQILLNHGIKHHAIVCEKIRASIYVDDKSGDFHGQKGNII